MSFRVRPGRLEIRPRICSVTLLAKFKPLGFRRYRPGFRGETRRPGSSIWASQSSPQINASLVCRFPGHVQCPFYVCSRGIKTSLYLRSSPDYRGLVFTGANRHSALLAQPWPAASGVGRGKRRAHVVRRDDQQRRLPMQQEAERIETDRQLVKSLDRPAQNLRRPAHQAHMPLPTFRG